MTSAAAFGQPADRPTTRPTTQPAGYWLRVAGERVNVRSRPDANSLVVARVSDPAVLEAVGQTYGWYEILPPANVFSYVHARYVDRLSHTEGVISVRSGNLRVRVGSLVYDKEPEDAEVQTLLPRGTPVKIVGTRGDWLKIRPPDSVRYYIAEEFADKISDAEARRLRRRAATQPTTAAGLAASRPADEPDLSGKWGQRLKRVEAAIEKEAEEEPLQQSWPRHIAQLRPIAAQADEPTIARLARGWVARLERRMVDQAALRAARQLAERKPDAETEHRARLRPAEQPDRRITTRPAFAARGQFLYSLILGDGDQPKYKLQDPVTLRVVAYIRLADHADIRPVRFLGKYVGVNGALRTNEKLGAPVILVDEIRVVRHPGPAERSAREKP